MYGNEEVLRTLSPGYYVEDQGQPGFHYKNSKTYQGTELVNLTVTQTTTAQYNYSAERDIVRDVRFYALGVIIPLGLISNVLAACVFLRTKLRKTTPGQYFLSLACADNLLLIGELIFWMNMYQKKGTDLHYRLGLHFMDSNNVACMLTHFIRYMGRLWSSWLVVVISAERLLTVTFPLHSSRISSIAKARIVIITTGILSAVLSCMAFVAVGSYEYRDHLRCLIRPDYRSLYSYYSSTVLTVGELILPSILVSIFTALIIWKLAHARRERVRSTQGQNVISRRARERAPTISLLAVAITFVTVRLPYIIAYNLETKKGKWEPKVSQWASFQIFTSYNVTFVLAVSNYAINFLLYCIFGGTFRAELMRCVRCQSASRPPRGSHYSTYRCQSNHSSSSPTNSRVNTCVRAGTVYLSMDTKSNGQRCADSPV